MVELIRVHRADHAQLVGNLMQMSDRVRHPDPAFPVLRELARRSQQLRRGGREGEALALEKLLGAILTVVLDEFGLVVEEVEVRW